ncbi:hypothetical protein GCM10025771_13860 [Niveibacterium umoris]
MTSTEQFLTGIGFAAGMTAINVLFNRFMARRNSQGRCAKCGETLDIYSATQDGFRGDYFAHCPKCARRVKAFRAFLYLCVALAAAGAVYFSYA